MSNAAGQLGSARYTGLLMQNLHDACCVEEWPCAIYKCYADLGLTCPENLQACAKLQTRDLHGMGNR